MRFIACSLFCPALAFFVGGCHAPAGAFAGIDQNNIKICAFVSDCEGRDFIRREITSPAEQAKESAEKLAKELLEAGGRKILEKLEK